MPFMLGIVVVVPVPLQSPPHVTDPDAVIVTLLPEAKEPVHPVSQAPTRLAGAVIVSVPPVRVTVSENVGTGVGVGVGGGLTVITPDAAVTVHDPPPTDAMMLPEPADVGVTMIV